MWDIIKKTAVDMWDEMFYLLIFNLIWVVGAILIIPAPFVTFGLFYTARDVGEGHALKFSTFFDHGRQTLKPAYIWGGINLALLAAIYLNFGFYVGVEAGWAEFIRIFLLALTFFWLLLQLVILALYPRLTEPSFKLALRNAAVIAGRHPLAILGLMLAAGLLLAITFVIPVLFVLIDISLMAVLTNNVVDRLVAQELDRAEQE